MATEMPFCDAHVLASFAETSRPSGAIVAVFAEPNAQFEDFERSEACEVSVVRKEAFDGSKSSNDGASCMPPSARSALLPAKTVIRCGLARAFASCRKVDRLLKEAREETS
jgi:hypothetical protein